MQTFNLNRLGLMFLVASMAVVGLLAPVRPVAAISYNIQQVTNNSVNDYYPMINNTGQIVWQTDEIYLYSKGVTKQLTNNSYSDQYPMINDSGQVVWYGSDGHDKEIYLYSNGVTKQLTNNDYDDYDPKINNKGQVVWEAWEPGYKIYLYSNGVTKQLTDTIVDGYKPWINDSGQVAWYNRNGIYLYSSGVTKQLAKNGSHPRINNSGQIVWMVSEPGYDSEIALYSNGVIKQLTNNSYSDLFPRINDNGQVVWYGSDGQDNEIYLYSNGVTKKLSNNSFNDDNPRFNNNGQVVWEGDDSSDSEIYLYSGGVIKQLTNNNYSDYDPQINDLGQVVWYGRDPASYDTEIYLARPLTYTPYTFKYTYGNGDYYTGTVYADNLKGYYLGKVWNKKDENGKTGTFRITGVLSSSDAYASKLGQIYVNTYYNAENKKSYVPMHKGSAVGTKYLGSELDYIINNGVADYKFGQGYYEADVGDKYAFRYYYGNGDYYQGYVYRTPGYVYNPGYKLTKKNELNLNGYYQILSMSYTGETTKYGKVFVDSYYNGENKKAYTPLKKGQAVGSAFLGSELDYIVKTGVAVYKFGQGYTEADVGDKYAFKYTYGNGDYYQGYVYRTPGYVYYPGYKLTKKNETEKTGYYQILSMTYTGETAKYGKVYVNTYHDGDRTTPKNFTPVNAAKPLGSSFLGSEAGYIIKLNTASYYFGKGYHEADE